MDIDGKKSLVLGGKYSLESEESMLCHVHVPSMCVGFDYIEVVFSVRNLFSDSFFLISTPEDSRRLSEGLPKDDAEIKFL